MYNLLKRNIYDFIAMLNVCSAAAAAAVQTNIQEQKIALCISLQKEFALVIGVMPLKVEVKR